MNHGNILIKVYGHVWPISTAVQDILCPFFPQNEHMDSSEMLYMENDMLCMNFEGLYFPLEELLESLTPHLTPHCKGKLDYLDLDAWTLTRHTIEGTQIKHATTSINNVLDYAGH